MLSGLIAFLIALPMFMYLLTRPSRRPPSAVLGCYSPENLLARCNEAQRVSL